MELGLSQTFRFLSTTNEGKKNAYQLKESERLSEFGFELLNRTYYSSPDGVDKNGDPYESAFNLLGFQVSKNIHPHFDLLGATYWAYQGAYGAYAEGLLGLLYKYAWTTSWEFRAKVLGGAAGGGGIDLGSGLVYQFGAGLVYQMHPNWGLSIGAGQMRGVKGSFTPLFTDIGIIYRFGTLRDH
jgi:hypothetical protein